MRRLTRDNLPHLVWCLKRSLRTGLDSCIARAMARWWGVSLGSHCTFRGLPIIYRMPGSKITIGNGCTFNSSANAHQAGIKGPCILWTLSENARILIGDNSGFSGTVLNAQCEIRIGNNVRCGANTTITDTDAHTDDARVNAPEQVIIKDGAWLGMNTVVLKGVIIGEGTLVGAKSLVTKSLPDHVIAAGVPARVIRGFD
ncbi:MAG: putative acetyltransferase [Syntrophus sp. PtaB.Bin138]|nr:MAG: putative acetyltransferase [Syntrophus sp. PtaB.Bin138]